MVELKNVIKRRKNNFELNIPDLKIKSNRIYALLGKNGAGKSTTIKIMLGIEKKDVVNDICTDAIFLKEGKIIAMEEYDSDRTFTDMFKEYLI